jgi:hypothetical protein
MIGDLEDFLNFARDRLSQSDDPLPSAPEDCAAVMGYLCALVPEYQLTRQADASNGEARRADRRSAVLAGFRRARGAPATPPAPASAGDDDDAAAPTEAA